MLRIESRASGGDGLELHRGGRGVGPWRVELERVCEDALTALSRLLLDLGRSRSSAARASRFWARLRDGRARLSNCSSFVAEQRKAHDVAGGSGRADGR
jgi:hypothetical protein